MAVAAADQTDDRFMVLVRNLLVDSGLFVSEFPPWPTLSADAEA